MSITRVPPFVPANGSRSPLNSDVDLSFTFAMETEHTPFMRDLEARFQKATGLSNRSQFKIFYGQVRPAPVLTLGINPGGSPANTSLDGTSQTDKKGRVIVASASAGFFENDEHDVVDCGWRENTGLLSLLTPYLGDDASRIRTQVVKTNLAFRRSAKKTDIDIEAAIAESAPFVVEIVNRVRPKLILLTGVALPLFMERYAKRSVVLAAPEKDPKVRQVVFAAARAVLRGHDREVLLVQVAHASQFSWTYAQYGVVERMHSLPEV